MPPSLIFLRKNFKDYYISNGPTGRIGVANGSGWMKETEFVDYLKHFAHFTRPTNEKKVLLISDNHTSHLSIPAIDFCSDRNIILLTLPPHSSIFGPFKAYFNTKAQNWVREHPGRAMTIYDLPGILRESIPLATTAQNSITSFVVTGIHVFPLNPDIFTEADFLPSMVTDQPNPHTSGSAAGVSFDAPAN